MGCSSDPRSCGRVFGQRFARRRSNRYRRRGLDRVARRMVDLVASSGLAGATVLEIGGGVGEITVELLKRGAATATDLELSDGYEAEANRLFAEAGLAGRVRRRIVDIAEKPDAAEAADIVVLHRVVCCYPDYAALLGAAADHARRQVVFSHPPANLAARTVIGMENLVLRMTGTAFRVFAHPPPAMLAVLEERGMRPIPVRSGRIWKVSAAER